MERWRVSCRTEFTEAGGTSKVLTVAALSMPACVQDAPMLQEAQTHALVPMREKKEEFWPKEKVSQKKKKKDKKKKKVKKELDFDAGTNSE